MTPSRESSEGARDHVDDLDLVARANRGDPAAFESLYRRHRDFALRVAMRHCGDADLAAEAVQEAFLWWLRQFPGFTLRASATTFVYTIVRSRCIDLLRRRGRSARVAAGVDDSSEPNERGESAAERDARSRVITAMEGLPPEQREALLLRYGHGLADREVALCLEIPVGTAKGRIRLGLATLRKVLGPGDIAAEDFWSSR